MSKATITSLGEIRPLGYERVVLNDTNAVSLNPPKKAILAILVVEVRPCRWRDDGTDPTPQIGMLLPEITSTAYGAGPMPYNGDPSKIRLIDAGQGSGAAVVNVSYYARSGAGGSGGLGLAR